MEFNQVAMANSEGSEVMLNRVMTKDNIGVAVLLEVNKDMFSGGKKGLSFCNLAFCNLKLFSPDPKMPSALLYYQIIYDNITMHVKLTRLPL